MVNTNNPDECSMTILHADSDLLLIQMSQIILGLYGYEVLTTSSMEKALEICATTDNRIALAILDLTLVDNGEGLELAKLLRSHDPAIKTIVSGPSHLSGEAMKQLEGVMDVHINKPYEMHELVDEVEHLLTERTEEIS